MSEDRPRYRRPECSIDRRVADLLDRMTTAEKAGQVVGTWAGTLDREIGLPEVKRHVREFGFGSVAAFGWANAAVSDPREIVEAVNDLQRVAREETRLGIPLLFAVDAVHGHAYVEDATVFPNGVGAGATWNPALVEQTAAATARAVRATGAHQNYAPTCDVAREPRWGRVQETFGESPRLTADLAAAKVRGYQRDGLDGEGVIATAKHFPAYGGPERGQDGAPVEVSDHVLYNTYLRPFAAAIDAGVRSVMPAYSATNGEPPHGSRRLLSGLLRGELGFDGYVVADWSGLEQLHDGHGVTDGWRASIHRARTAGLDVGSVDHTTHVEELIALLEDGQLSEARIDASVRRLLRVKFELGLFDDPFVDPGAVVETVGCDSHRDLAREAAVQSLTLLKNDGLLPLSGGERVFVGGPNADSLLRQVGGWSHHDDSGLVGATVREAVAARDASTVCFEQGATLSDPDGIDEAVATASDADVALLALGEGWYIHEFGPTGQADTATGVFPTRSTLRLPAAQRDLADAIAATGTPVVVVLLTGRPLIVPSLADTASALLMAYFPGTEGGHAIADVLFGDRDPGGRLPVSMPRSMGDLPQHHDWLAHPTPLGPEEHPPAYDPLYPFGHGESYTTFETRDLEVAATTVGPAGTIPVSVTVENAGSRRGTTVIQVFASQETPSLIRPGRFLVGYERVALDPGTRRTVDLQIPVERFGYDRAGEGHVVESDSYQVHLDGATASFAVERSVS